MKSIEELRDELLELEIAEAAKHVEIAQQSLERRDGDYFLIKHERDHWSMVMYRLIKSRSSAHVERLESGRGLSERGGIRNG